MAGELWQAQWEMGKETTAGTAVASTRQMYFSEDSRLTREREPRPKRFSTGTRDNVRAMTLGPEKVSGTVSMQMSASEIIELLLITLKGGVTPTGAGSAKLWTFVPGSTALESATARWHDGARPWMAAGLRGDKLKIAGSVKGDNTVSCDLFGMSMIQQALTGSLAARVPDFLEGWETKFYLDTFGGTAGSTAVAGELINWDIEISNGLARKYWANNTLSAGAVTPSAIEVSAKLLIEAAPAAALTEYNNWEAATKRLARLEFGQNEVISGADKKFVTLDLPGAWDGVDLGQTDENTRAYEMSLQYVYDTTNTFGLQVRAQNARATAW